MVISGLTKSPALNARRADNRLHVVTLRTLSRYEQQTHQNPRYKLATNPCPCGNHGVPGAECTCPPAAVRRYLGRLSGPLRDRVDIELSVRRVSLAQLHGAADGAGVTTDTARGLVAAARRRAAERLRDTPWTTNARVPGTWLRSGPLAPGASVRRPLDAALQRGALTLRGYDRVLRVAWTIADLAGRARLELDDVGRALFLKKGAHA
nr:ATP-binding protein [Microbacterium telephonicum]